MMARLNTSVNMLPVLAPSDITPGLVCSASSSIDKRWYRAVVISQEDSQVGPGGVRECIVWCGWVWMCVYVV